MSTLNGADGDRLTGADGFREWFWDWSFVLPFVWVMFSASRGLGVFESKAALEAVETDALQGSPEGFVYLALVLGGIVLLAASRFDWRGFLGENPVLVGIYALILVSTFWSEVPFITLKRFVKTFGVLIMVALFFTDGGERKVIRFLALFVGVYLLWSLAYIIFVPSLGIGTSSLGEPQLIGIAHTKNSLAQVALAGCLVYGYTLLLGGTAKVISFMFLALCFGSIIVVDSVTCLLLGGLSMAGLLMYRGVRRAGMEFRSLALMLSMIFVALLVIFLMFHAGDGGVSKVLSGFDRDITLTGRVDLWKDVLAAVNTDWLLGKGYGAFWLDGMGNELWDIYVCNRIRHIKGLSIFICNSELWDLSCACYGSGASWGSWLVRRSSTAMMRSGSCSSLYC